MGRVWIKYSIITFYCVRKGEVEYNYVAHGQKNKFRLARFPRQPVCSQTNIPAPVTSDTAPVIQLPLTLTPALCVVSRAFSALSNICTILFQASGCEQRII